ncbi:hypothetical protein DLP79_23145, partial [Salmonella enterica]|nr:hypothetical protein [Salmonella enterica]
CLPDKHWTKAQGGNTTTAARGEGVSHHRGATYGMVEHVTGGTPDIRWMGHMGAGTGDILHKRKKVSGTDRQ